MPQALPPPDPPPAIVVTARALPETAAARAYGVEVVGRRELVDAPSSQLDQILKAVPGLQLFRRSDARSGHPTSQGVTLRALGGNASSRALLVLDGVPQSDPFGGWVNWPAYDPASLAEVKVTRGGGSVAHGAGALAGTIEIVSWLGPGTAGAVEAGSRESLLGRMTVGTGVGDGAAMLSGRVEGGDGFVPITADTRGPADRAAPYRAASLRGYLAKPISPRLELQASLAGFRDKRDRGLEFTGNRTDGADASLRLVGTGSWAWSALGYAQWRELESSFASVDAGRAAATRVALQDSVPSRGVGAAIELRPPLGPGLELRVGMDARHTSGETRELFSYVSGVPTRRRVAGGETLISGLFAEMAAGLGALGLSGGIRLDHWGIADGSLLERQIATGAVLRSDRYAARSGRLPTARAGAVVDAGGGLSLRSAAYLGWRLPTLNELFRPFRVGPDATAANSELDPERLAGAEIGARYRRGDLSLGATMFANRLTDGIANVTLGTGPGTFPGVGFVAGDFRQRRNIDAIEVRGLEASGEFQLGAWSARLGYSFADARVDASGFAAPLDELRPAQTPRHTVSGQLEWRSGGRVASFGIRHVGAQFEDDLNRQRLPPATTVDAFGGWPMTRQLQLVIRGENLLDEEVAAGIGGDGAVERATPRTLWIGLRLTSRSVSTGGMTD